MVTDNEVNQASKDAQERGEIGRDMQLNPADVGHINNKGEEVPPFNHDEGIPGTGLPDDQSLNPADKAGSKTAAKKKGK